MSNSNTPFSKKPNYKAGVINKLQISKDDIDDEAIKMLDQKSIDQLSNENESIVQEINKLNQEFLDINEKSNNIEALLKSQQQCISLLNKDNDELKAIADQAAQKANGKRKKSKHIKESDLMTEIHLSIEKQDTIVQNSMLTVNEDQMMNKIASIRKVNLHHSTAYLSNFDSIIIRRQKLIDRYKEYSDEMINHTKRNKLLEEYENLSKENQELNEIFAKRNEQKNKLEKKKKKLADIENSISEMLMIKNKIEDIEQEINEKKSYPYLSQILQQDAQDTQNQLFSTQIYESVECQTDSPLFSTANDKDLKNQIIQFEKEIADFKQQKEFEGAEIKKKLEILRDQFKEMSQEIDLFIKHLFDISS